MVQLSLPEIHGNSTRLASRGPCWGPFGAFLRRLGVPGPSGSLHGRLRAIFGRLGGVALGPSQWALGFLSALFRAFLAPQNHATTLPGVWKVRDALRMWVPRTRNPHSLRAED
eukprot:5391417-Pyramimonas_sp.AAC.1